MKKEHEPDFYAMDRANPLPAVDEAALPPGVPTESNMMRGPMGGAPGGMSPMRSAMAGADPMMANREREMLMMRSAAAGGMSPMRGASGMSDMMYPRGGMGPMGPMSMASMAGGGASEMMYKDPLLSRGMGMGAGMGFGSGSMMNNSMMMGSHPMMMNQPGMMGSAGFGMDSMAGMGGMGAGMSPMSSAFRESQAAAGDMEFQRLRQIQQMHMLDRAQMGQGSMMAGSEAYERMRNMEMRLGR